MNTALIIEKDFVTIVKITNWENQSKDYIKLTTESGKKLICSKSHLKLENKEETETYKELVSRSLGRVIEIKFYEETNTKKLVK